MAGNLDPIYTSAGIVGAGLTSTTSQAALSGVSLTNGTTIVTGATNGTKVEEITVTPVNTVLAGTVNIFLVDGSNNWWLFDQVPIAAQTLTAGTPQIRWSKVYPNLVVPIGYTLSVTQTGQTTNALAVVALGGTF